MKFRKQGDNMNCPVCNSTYISDDASVVEKKGRRVILQGIIHAIDVHIPPFSDYFTVSLYPRKGRVKYLKFASQNELKKYDFIKDKRIRCEGCLHEIDEKEVVFDIVNVAFLQ